MRWRRLCLSTTEALHKDLLRGFLERSLDKMSVPTRQRANFVRFDCRDVLNLYAHLPFVPSGITPDSKDSFRKTRSSFLKLVDMPIGTLVAKKESEQEGYKE